MKCLVSLIALIALLGCGSDSNLITPDPAMDMEQPAERNESCGRGGSTSASADHHR